MNLKFSASYSSISKYVDELYDGFVPSVVGKARTTEFITVVPDVKYSKVVPTVNSTVDFADASSCATFDNNGTTAVVGVTLTTSYLKYEEKLCLNEMEQYYFGQYMTKGSDQESLPFEQAFMDEKMGKLAKKLDTIFWQGNTTPSITGILSQVQTGGINVTGSSFAVSTAANNGVIATFDAMYDALGADMKGEELVLFCGQDTFDKYTRSLRNLNFYHFTPDEIEGGSVRMFGARNVTVVATVGLNGQNKAVLTKGSFLMWGTDLAPTEEPIKAHYDFVLDSLLLRYKVKIAAGIAFVASAVIGR